jgi:hypothetical protein
MQNTDNKPTSKPVKIIDKTPIQSNWNSSETQERLLMAISKAAEYGLITNNAFLDKLKIIIDAFSYYCRDEKYRFPDCKAIVR